MQEWIAAGVGMTGLCGNDGGVGVLGVSHFVIVIYGYLGVDFRLFDEILGGLEEWNRVKRGFFGLTGGG